MHILYYCVTMGGIILSWNEKSKGEQFFLLMMICTVVVGFFCLSGFYVSDCETPQFAKEDGAIGCSLPGCGSCDNNCDGESTLCEGCFCAESYKCVCVNSSDISLVGCDERYMLTDCEGCHSERSCYCGYLSDKTEENPYCGIYYGDTSPDSDERLIGCADGCFVCMPTTLGGDLLEEVEEFLEID